MQKEFVRLSHHGENFNIRTITIDAHQSAYLTKTHFHEYIEIIMPTSDATTPPEDVIEAEVINNTKNEFEEE